LGTGRGVATRERTILHVDMDAFYASVEQHDDPQLAGKPLIVGGTSQRGVVAAASYEARRFGVRSAMPMRMALEKCPQAICVRPRMRRYQEVSRRVFAIFRAVTPLVEGLSLDEAFLDVSETPQGAPQIAVAIKERIHRATGLTASVGVAPNKLVAKIASDLAKPDGLTIVTRDTIHEVLDPLPVRSLPGLGRKTGARVVEAGIATLGELRRAPDALLRPIFGRYADRIRERASGIDDRPVSCGRDEKSVSAEDTFERDIADPHALAAELAQLADRATERLRASSLATGCVCVKIRRHDFATFTRRRRITPTQERGAISTVAGELLARWLTEHPRTKLRLLGVALSQLCPATQLDLFGERRPSLDAAIDAIHQRFGSRALRRATSIK
jgi:DNA polymerase IV